MAPRVKQTTTNRRVIAVYAAFLILLSLVWVRCLWLQVVSGRQLVRLHAAQYRVVNTLLAPRGDIYDRNGRLLATSVRVPSVFANPRQVTAKDQTAVRVADLLAQDSETVNRRLSRDKGFVWLARQVNPELKDQLGQLRRAGIGMVEEAQRRYPNGTMASHILGAVDIDHKGLEGLELFFNNVLRGRSGWQAAYRDAKGDLLIGPWSVQVEPQDGYSLVLTIDSVVQEAADEALAWGVEKYHATGGSLIVMDPHSGVLLALANQPTFDPNHPGDASAEARRNRAITDLLEPGSVLKIVTASALLEEGAIQPEERLFCEEGAYRTVGRHTLHDHRPHGWLTFHEIIQYSSNIGTSKAAQRLSPQALYHYIQAFGLGRKTGIGLPGEVRGIVPPPATWSKLSPFIIPIGQEIAVTPIQLAVMTSVIANGGFLVHPALLDRIQTSAGEVVREYHPQPPTRILRPETTATVESMLLSVVQSGTGQLAKVQGLTVAGKTGTAQKIEPNGRYSHSRYIASFVGYGPVPDSRFVIVVTVDEPRPAYFGGVVAAPIFRHVVERLSGYWHLKPAVELPTLVRLP